MHASSLLTGIPRTGRPINGPTRRLRVDTMRLLVVLVAVPSAGGPPGMTWAATTGGRAADASGADTRFWSFRPLAAPRPPAVETSVGSEHPIDRFVQAKLEERTLSPAAQADCRTLIRRVALDLTGLPPSPGEIDAFAVDPSPSAYASLLDRFLASPHYGERWARHWLDVARFAESGGFEHDQDRPHAFHYRDFVIQALNADMPYDQFVRWQLAGDEWSPDEPLAMMATGFLAAGVFPSQITEDEFELARYDQLDDMVTTTGVAFLGMTFGCARCHDHKYDPVTTRDYYRLAASFATTIPARARLKLTSPHGKRFARHEFAGEVRRLKQQLEALAADQEQQRNELQNQLSMLREKSPESYPVPVRIGSEGLPPIAHHADGRGYPHFYPEVHHLKRGDPNQKEEVARQGFPPLLRHHDTALDRWWRSPPAGCRTSFRRRALSSWLTDSERGAGHLLARVIVNRLWQHHFGRGIVATPNDFGTQGARPTHPELLDWLATELIRGGWRLKRVHRLIMTSRAYRQSCDHDAENARRDPDNQYFWKQGYRRLEAEAIRDSLLAVSGMLDRRMFGPGMLDQQTRRRSIYFTIKRSRMISCLQVLDTPEPLVSIARRASTTTAPQALLFLNSPLFVSCSRALARRIEPSSDASLNSAICELYRLALGRSPTAVELALHRTQIAQDLRDYRKTYGDSARCMALANFTQLVLALNEFVYQP